ncbi:MAG: endonuclease domain-containing protein [Candidatus Saccharimonadales bacterium]
MGRTKGKYCVECRTANKRRAHALRIAKFGLPDEDYWRLYEAQGGTCAIRNCKANGRTRFLSVDHDHKCTRGHDPIKNCCRYCVRGLTCSMHNGWLGKAGDDPLVFLSLYDYLIDPPAQRLFRSSP